MDCAVFVVLEVLDGTSWRVRDEFENFQDKAGEGEDVARRVVATIGVAVLAENDVLVAMHDLDSPMIAIAGQQSLWRGGAQAGDEMNDRAGVQLDHLAGLVHPPEGIEQRL